MITSFIMRNGRVALPLGEREVSALKNYQVVATAILDVLCQSNHKPSGGRSASSPSDDPSQVDHNNQTDDLLRAIELLEWVSHDLSPLREVRRAFGLTLPPQVMTVYHVPRSALQN
jgi:hypothetical protein